MHGAHDQGLLLLGRQGADPFGRTAHDHGAIGKFFALGHQGARSHNAAASNFGAVEHYRADTDQRSIANGAAMQHHLVPNGDMVAHRQRFAHIRVQHTAILDVGAFPNADGLGVSPDDGTKPHIGLRCELHISQHLGAVRDPCVRCDTRLHTIQLINCHEAFSNRSVPRIVGMELRQRALDAFLLPSAVHKARAVLALCQEQGTLALDRMARMPVLEWPGRPERPVLVHPAAVGRRSPYTPQGHAALVHSIAHIEFNAINLALDAVWRFDGLPEDFYRDWLRVAGEEARHFLLLQAHLLKSGHGYGDFVAHDGLWTMCRNTAGDVVARMALVPRTLEARGLDATPLIQAKLRKVGSPMALEAVGILDTILQEEVGHVAIGNKWYHWLCERAGLDPHTFYAEASRLHGGPQAKPPFNLAARRMAGFTEAEIAALPSA